MSKEIAKELLKMAKNLGRESAMKYDTIGEVVKEMRIMMRDINTVYYGLLEEEESDDYSVKFNRLYAKTYDILEDAENKLSPLARKE